MEAENRPVALLPSSTRNYRLYDLATRTSVPVTPEVATSLASFAYTFFRPLPVGALTARDLLRFALRDCKHDFGMILLMGAAIGVLGLVPPIATKVVFDRIVPSGDGRGLATLVAGLLAAAIAAAVFQLVRGLAVLRIETRIGTAMQAAIWDRLLRLPVPFFRQFAAGDLAARAMGIDTIRQLLTGSAIASLLAGLFSLFNLGLLFAYDAALAVLATILVLVAVGATAAASSVQLRYERPLSALRASIAGTVLQLIGGISKLRVAGAEGRAYAVWAAKFTTQRKLAYQAQATQNRLEVFNGTFPIVASIAIFAVVALRGAPLPSTGTFLAFVAAFGGLLAAALEMSLGVLSILRIVPLFEQAQPILQTLPEVDQGKANPGELRGAIDVSHVSFRYSSVGRCCCMISR